MYVDAFSLLSAQRETSMDGVQPIAISEMLIYASEIGIDDRDIFIKHMCVMDRAYRKHIKNKQSANNPSTEKPPVNNG